MTAGLREVELAMAAAEARQAQQAQQRQAAVQQIMAIFLALQVATIVQDWVGGIGNRIYTLLALAQKIAASDSEDYFRRVLTPLGLDLGEIPEIDYDIFAGIASDNRDLDSLLAGAVIRVRQHERAGDTPQQALQAGADYLRMVVKTQISDASRSADAVLMIVADDVRQIENRQPIRREEPRRTMPTVDLRQPEREPAVDRATIPTAPPRVVRTGERTTLGWIRVLDPPSCGRCAVLAGRFYKWSDGFLRHPNCDCKHMPVTVAASEGLTVNPYEYFESLSEADQDDLFGKGNAEAIRNGADINQVVNATARKNGMYTADNGRRYTREGTTRRGFYGRRGTKVRRPTPWQIMKDSQGNREVATGMLARFGYIVQ
jgi:hypothetical protein